MSLKNPHDNTSLYDFDLPSEGLDEEEERELLLGGDQREQALRQKNAASALTESRAFAILAEYVKQQEQARMNHLLMTTITDANRDEFNFMRGEVVGLKLALKFAQLIADGAEATLELLQEAKKDNAA